MTTNARALISVCLTVHVSVRISQGLCVLVSKHIGFRSRGPFAGTNSRGQCEKSEGGREREREGERGVGGGGGGARGNLSVVQTEPKTKRSFPTCISTIESC